MLEYSSENDNIADTFEGVCNYLSCQRSGCTRLDIGKELYETLSHD